MNLIRCDPTFLYCTWMNCFHWGEGLYTAIKVNKNKKKYDWIEHAREPQRCSLKGQHRHYNWYNSSLKALFFTTSVIIYICVFLSSVSSYMLVYMQCCAPMNCAQECVQCSNLMWFGMCESGCSRVNSSRLHITSRQTGIWCSSTFPLCLSQGAQLCRRAAERELRIDKELPVM